MQARSLHVINKSIALIALLTCIPLTAEAAPKEQTGNRTAQLLIQPVTGSMLLIEPGPPVMATLYAGQRHIQLATQTIWRPMCGSDVRGLTIDQFRRIVESARTAAHATITQVIDRGAARMWGGNFDVIFNITGTLPPGAAAALTDVEAYMEGVFTDSVTVTIDLSFAPLGPGILGSTGSKYVTATWPNARDGLVAGQDGDDTIQSSIPSGNTILVRYDRANSTVTDENEVYVTRANYNATIGSAPGTAATMQFSSNFTWDFTPPDISSSAYCFQSVIIHEVGHALGFTSGADFRTNDIEMLDVFRFPVDDGAADYNPDTITEFSVRPRYVDKDEEDALTGTCVPNISDDANSDLIAEEFLMADGCPWQASHFSESDSANYLMDPAIAPGDTFFPSFFRAGDLAVLDAIGWDYLFPLEISGSVSDGFSEPLSRVLIWADNAPVDSSDLSDAFGEYSFLVPWGWSGRVTASKEGYTFSPPYRAYDNITSDQSRQDFVGTLVPTGACCAPVTLSCSIMSGADCASWVREYLGDGTTCQVGPRNVDACDCNDNGLLDREEIAGHDCNTNGILDACDISSGLSQDANQNGIPDECDPAPPGISDGKVIPTNGSDLTVFRFEVTYKDPTGRNPLQYSAGIFPVNGNWDYHGMREGDGTVATGRVYYYETQLPQGSYWRRFHFETADHDHIYYPESVFGDPGPTVGTPGALRVDFCAARDAGASPTCNPGSDLYQEGDLPSFYWDVQTPDGNPCCDCVLQLYSTPPNPIVRPILVPQVSCGHYEYGTSEVPGPNWQFGCGCYSFLAVATHPGYASGQHELAFETCPCPSVPPIEITSLSVTPSIGVPGATSVQINHCINLAAREMLWIKEPSGEIVRTLVDRVDRASGCWSDSWDGRRNDGSLVPPGEYSVEIEAIHLDNQHAITRFAPRGTGVGEVGVIHGLAFTLDTLLVLSRADCNTQKVVAFDRTGAFLREWPVPCDPGGCGLINPLAMTADAAGRLFALTHAPNGLQVNSWQLSADRSQLQCSGCQLGSGAIRSPTMESFAPIAYDPAGDRVLVWGERLSTSDDVLFAFNAACGPLDCVYDVTPTSNSQRWASGAAIDGDGNIWVSTDAGTFVSSGDDETCSISVPPAFPNEWNSRFAIRNGRLVYWMAGTVGDIQVKDLRGNWLQSVCVQAGSIASEERYIVSPDGPATYAISKPCEQGGEIVGVRIEDHNSAALQSQPLRLVRGVVSVTQPEESDTWIVGTTRTIRWNSLGTIDNVTVRLLKAGIEVPGAIPNGTNTANDGELEWTIPDSLPFGDNYAIKVEDIGDPSVYDVSDGSLRILTKGGDLNGDGLITLEDYSKMGSCINGPDSATSAGTCGGFDTDADNDVDLLDFADFQNVFGVPAP